MTLFTVQVENTQSSIGLSQGCFCGYEKTSVLQDVYTNNYLEELKFHKKRANKKLGFETFCKMVEKKGVFKPFSNMTISFYEEVIEGVA